MDQIAATDVFEYPWRYVRDVKPLHQATVEHVQVTDFFLKLLAYFPKDADGLITDEALVLSEWRYIAYIRFLHDVGLAPVEVPPPWDVAMIWYCHLLSTTKFHHHLVDNKHITFGLEYSHFPLAELVKLIDSGKWIHSGGKKEWAKYNGDPKWSVYGLQYQLWPECPWKEDNSWSRRLFRKSATLTKTAPDDISIAGSQRIFQRVGSRGCALQPTIPKSLECSLEEYTLFRSGSKQHRCRAHRVHVRFEDACEVAPWPTVHHLKTALYRQAAFWNALSKAKSSQPGFLHGLQNTDEDYKIFMTLFQKHHSKTVHDPEGNGREHLHLMPPTLEVDLFWHTHRLFPGCYWRWCTAEIGRLVDHEVVVSPEAVRATLAKTKNHWERAFPSTYPHMNTSEQWLEISSPDAAILAPTGTVKTSMEIALAGRRPWRKHRSPPGGLGKMRSEGKRSRQYGRRAYDGYGYTAGGSSFGGGDGGCSGGGGGDGGGGGGGGGGGDGGGC